jgi:predicted DNA-binding protein (UPF0251 family)
MRKKTTQAVKELRSEKMKPSERAALRLWVKAQRTNAIAAETLGVSRSTLDRLCVLGSGKPESLRKIKATI